MKYKGSLQETVETTPTDVWNDSCSIQELTYSIGNGSVGATTNPQIVGAVLKKEMHLWKDRINAMIKEMPEASEVDIAWKLIEEMALKGAELLMPVFKKHNGMKGRISIQTNIQDYLNWKKMSEQAIHFNTLAENMQIKMPVTKAGLKAIEETTAAGVSINATVSFTVPQALAVAEAVERGLKRRETEGKDTSKMTPVCTIMVGRVDDWLRVIAGRENIAVTPGVMDWAGVAVFKNAYRLYKERGYRCRLLSAAYRNHLQWSEFIGGDVVLTIPYRWQQQFNKSDIKVIPRMDNPVDPAIIAELKGKFPDFIRAYEADGMTVEEFDTYGALVRTIRGFLGGYMDLLAIIRDFMIPNPDN
jgi:transaldolase